MDIKAYGPLVLYWIIYKSKLMDKFKAIVSMIYSHFMKKKLVLLVQKTPTMCCHLSFYRYICQ